MRIVGYVRVSTDKQAEQGLGPEIQERAIRAWAKANGHRVVAVFSDLGVSGSNGLGSRIGLADALEQLRDGKATGIVVAKIDRLARDLIVQEQILAEARRLGGDVFSCSPAEAGYLADDPDDPSRKLIRQVLGAVSEYERSMVALRLRMGRRRKAERGGFAFGAPPFGWKAEGRELVPVPGEQAILERITDMRRGGFSLRAIADGLTTEGHRPRRGERWHPETLRKIIDRQEAASV